MDIWERAREKVADMVSAWRAVGREPQYVHATADGAVLVSARAKDYSSATIVWRSTGWYSYIDGASELTHGTVAEAASNAVRHLDECDAATVRP